MKRAVIDVLKRIALGHELLGQARGRGFSSAAWALRSVRDDLTELAARGELENLKGVGPAVAGVIAEVVRGEKPAALTELEEQVPAGLFEVAELPGIGPKKVKSLWQELKITTLGELEYACRENRLLTLKGFGKKTQAKILTGIARRKQFEGWFRRDQVAALAASLRSALAGAPGVEAVHVSGDFRRGCELVRALELVVVGPGAAAAVSTLEPPEAPPLVLHATEAAYAGPALARTTGSTEHWEALCARAAERGLFLGEAGLYRDDALVACATEEELYAALGLLPTAPERREAGVPLCQQGQARPRLVRRADLCGALHNHTTASDGADSLPAMQEAAAARGLRYLGISEHSVSAFYARGLEAAGLTRQRGEIERLNDGADCTLLRGVESDILADGSLDYPPEILAGLEFVIASVHRRHGQSSEEMTARLERAAHNPWTSVVGHPTGRLLLGRAPSAFDVEAFLDACAAGGCAVELNASPHRLDLKAEHLALARERGLLVSIAADAHSCEALDNLDYGISIARRAGLTPDEILNCRPLDALREWLRARREAALAAG